MIGYVYESLSNVAEQLEDLDKDSRKEFGIFYTPKEEVYFMVRRSLVEYLNNNTDVSKRKIYKLVFAESDEEKDQAREEISSGEFNRITRTLRQMDAVDPACGSGAFLVGIIDVIAEIYRIAEGKDKRQFDMFETKKKIIQESIYGVDVKDWAINASELRLFLQLLIETDVDKEKIQQNALLPNLRANLRVGDSLVQDIDGMFFDLRRSQLSVDSKTWMDEIQKEKSYFFDSRSKSKYNNIGDIKGDEIKFFRQVIDDKIDELEEKLDDENEKQQTLNGKTKEPSGNEKRQITRKKKKTKERIEKLEDLKKEVTQTQEKMPLIWEVAFAEVFNTEKEEESGFDLLIGNPPYVRQEDIAPPNMDPDEVTKQDKKDYKNKLIESVQNRTPQVEKISKRSDLYIYFYFHGLSLINDEGTFAFITSNSWLDVGYGKELQKFLCKHVPIKGIYNNKNNRSFEHADVNTVISVFGAPNFETKSFGDWEIDTDKWPETDHEAQFVTFKKPYREAVNAENMIALENDQHYDKEIQLDRSNFELYNTQDLRSVQITQGNLLEDGWQYPENFDGNSFEKGKYKGNKWGGKFLRAPDIFFDILDKGGENIKEVKEYADVEYGIKTGANKFFYVKILPEENIENAANFDHFQSKDISEENVEVINFKEDRYILEKKYLKPVIKSPKECSSSLISNGDFKYHVLFVRENEEIEDTLLKDYIDRGEKEEYHERSTIQSRSPWYSLAKDRIPEVIMPCGIGKTYKVYYNDAEMLNDKRLYEVYTKRPKKLATIMNSSVYMLAQELNSRVGLGDGLLDLTVYEVEEALTIDPKSIDDEKLLERNIEPVFKEFGIERNKPIREQEPSPLPDRKELDDIVFDALGLSEDERKEVYWSVAELVKARLDKAESV
ncbi:MAG: Eco57I restriction-modification methylase domain-containing protein [Candidatus Nanohaloarchaea archaeon]